ncbi:MAG: hypothetical protein M3R04_08495 [bacterium]|nr:hypothetical protein [bacterium]
MGDRTWTSIRFSGAIKRADAHKLIEELEAQGCESNRVDSRDLKIEDLIDAFHDYECNYAQMEGVEALAKELNISYFKTWQAGGDYGAGSTMYNALVGLEFNCVDIDGGPAVTLKELKSKPVEDTITYLEAFANWEGNNPPLKVVD